MQPTGKLLERIEIATPCQADWAAMSGDERVRFCQLCRLNVYNLSGMSRAEGEALITKTEGKVCVRMFRREDGTVLTSDCPLGKRIVRGITRGAKIAAATLAGVFGLAGIAAWALNKSADDSCAVTSPAGPRPTPPPQPMMGAPRPIRMGKVALPPQPNPTQRPVMGEVELRSDDAPVTSR